MSDVGNDVGASGTGPADLPVRRVTVNAIVAYNMAAFRRSAGLKQEELGELIGWGNTVVSTAERSWDAKRIRSFTVDDIVAIAEALGVPLAALFLPPADDGAACRYVVEVPGRGDIEARALLPLLFPPPGGKDDSPAMKAFRERLILAGSIGYPGFIGLEHAEISQLLAEQAAAGGAEMLVRTGGFEHLAELREELENRIDDMRAFERGYRMMLQKLLIDQLRQLGQSAVDSEDILVLMNSGATKDGSAVLLRPDGTYEIILAEKPGEDRPERGKEDP